MFITLWWAMVQSGTSKRGVFSRQNIQKSSKGISGKFYKGLPDLQILTAFITTSFLSLFGPSNKQPSVTMVCFFVINDAIMPHNKCPDLLVAKWLGERCRPFDGNTAIIFQPCYIICTTLK